MSIEPTVMPAGRGGNPRRIGRPVGFVGRTTRWLAAVVLLPSALAASPPSYWDRQRRGANLFNRVETAERLRAAAAAGIDFVRLAPNKWVGTGRDFLLGDADRFTAIPGADLARLRSALDDARAADLKVVVTTLSLPGARWRQHHGNRSDFRLWREARYANEAEAFWRQLAAALRGHQALAGYNLVNEPHPDPSGPCDVCPTPSDPGALATERKLAEVQAQALRATDLLQRQQQGESTLWPLLALLKAQEELAGRKTIVFFSPGLRIPPNLDNLFRTAIGQANRANVSIYSVDVRGLDTTRELLAAGNALRQAAATAYLQSTRGEGAVTRDEAQNFDMVEDALRLNAAGTLRDLAESTGGLLIANSNELGRKLEQVASDLRVYYEVSYAPARIEYDGKFRRIEVKVARKGVRVQARSGYFALPPGGSTLLPYEVPLLGALSTRSQAHDFEVRPGLAFGETGESTIAIEVPLDGLPFALDPRKKTYRLGLSIMAVVESQEGEVVERVSDDYPITGPASALDEVRVKKAVLRRRIALPPGEYVLEAVALERESDRASVGRWRFSVPERNLGEAVASLAAVAPGPRGSGSPPSKPTGSEGAALGRGALGSPLRRRRPRGVGRRGRGEGAVREGGHPRAAIAGGGPGLGAAPGPDRPGGGSPCPIGCARLEDGRARPGRRAVVALPPRGLR